jgi:hypothetical protein
LTIKQRGKLAILTLHQYFPHLENLFGAVSF